MRTVPHPASLAGNLHDLWLGFTATWPIWLFMAALVAYAVWACRANDQAKKAQRRDAERMRTLAHISTSGDTAEQRLRAAEARARLLRSPANQRTAAPWFVKGGE